MKVNMNKTKVMISGEWQKVMQKAVRWLRGVCGRGIGNNSIQCTSCQKWVHRKCSGIKVSMYKVTDEDICLKRLRESSNRTGCTSVDIGVNVYTNVYTCVSCTSYWVDATCTNKCLHHFVHATFIPLHFLGTHF